MKNDNETVNDIRAEVGEYLSCIGPSEFPCETQVEEFADRFEAAHKREIAAKDAEIARLKACRDGDCERLRLGAEPCEGCHVQIARDEIDKLRALVKELADALESMPVCGGNCEKCNSSDICRFNKERALVAKAREVCR